MSLVSGDPGGSQAMAPEKRTLCDPDVRRARAAQMLVQKLAGWSSPRIGLYFNCTRQWVNRQIKAIPEAERRTIVRRFRRGEVTVA